mmetsp:Transcript_93129/g.269002  ORF Transcript_93129/g.269002 Transcript_93129/m.269002 type:complete len:1120 (-) Transcript_93129:170-3529(-)
MKARFDLYVRYTVEIDIANLFRTLEQLNQMCNQQFGYVLREYIPSLQLFGCFQLPGIGGPPAVALRTDGDLAAYHSRMPSSPIYEVHIPDAKMGMVAHFYREQLDNQQVHINRLTEQLTSLRQQGQGMQQGFSFLQQVAPAKDDQVLVVVKRLDQGIVPCVTAMQGSPQDQWTNQQGLRVLMLYGLDDAERLQEINHTNGFESVVSAMKAFPQDMMIQQYAHHIVANAAQFPEHRTALYKLGAIQPIISNLQHIPNDVRVQVYGCWALANLAENPEYRTQIVELKGIEAMVTSLKHHPREPSVARYVMTALTPLAWQPECAMQILHADGVPAILTSLQHHQNQPMVAFHAIQLLAELAKQDECRVQLANVGVVPILLQTMRAYPQQQPVQESGLMCLATLCIGNESNQSAVFHHQGIPYVVQALRSQTGSEESTVGLVHQATYLLAQLAQHVECRPQICKCQGVDTVIEIMKRYPEHVGIQHQAMRFISGLGASPEALQRLIHCGSLEAAVTSMQILPSEVEVQLHGCYAVGQLAAPPEIKTRLLQNGGVTVLLQAMHSHPKDQHIHEQAAAALSIVCELDQAKEAMTHLKVGHKGHEVLATQLVCHSLATMYVHPEAIKQVLKLTALICLHEPVKVVMLQGSPPAFESVCFALKQHSEDSAVTYYCFKSFANLAHPYPPKESMQTCVELLECVVQGMKRFASPRDARVQEAGCEVISKLALLEELQDAIHVKGVIGVVCHALKTYQSDQGIQRKGCRALANIAEYETSRIEIRNQGGIKCVVNSMRYHVAHPEVGEQGCAALANLALNEQNRVEIANSEGVKAVLAGLRQHQNHPGIQAYGLGALGNLAVHEGNCHVILQAGAVQMVVHAMRTWPDEARVQHFACLACSNIAHDDANKVEIGKAGGNRLIVAAMQRLPDHVGLQEQGCGALANLGIHAHNMVEIAQLNGIELVVQALRRHCQSKGVQENACFALSKFLAMPNESYKQRMKVAGAEEALINVRDGDPPPDFDVRICVNVLIRRLNEEARPEAQHQPQQVHPQSFAASPGMMAAPGMMSAGPPHVQTMQMRPPFPTQGQAGPAAIHIQHVQPVPAMGGSPRHGGGHQHQHHHHHGGRHHR